MTASGWPQATVCVQARSQYHQLHAEREAAKAKLAGMMQAAGLDTSAAAPLAMRQS